MIIISLIALVILFVLLTFVWPPDSPWSPWWRTNRKVARAAARLAKIKKSDSVVELGSGDGEFVLVAAAEFSAKKSVGVEIEHTRYWISKIKKQISKNKNAVFIRSDFKKVNISEYDVVYFYLVPNVIKRIMPKLKKELRPGTRIVSLRYEVPLRLVKEDRKNKLFLYIV